MRLFKSLQNFTDVIYVIRQKISWYYHFSSRVYNSFDFQAFNKHSFINFLKVCKIREASNTCNLWSYKTIDQLTTSWGCCHYWYVPKTTCSFVGYCSFDHLLYRKKCIIFMHLASAYTIVFRICYGICFIHKLAVSISHYVKSYNKWHVTLLI